MENLMQALRNLGPARILSLLLGLAAVIAILGIVIDNVSKPGMALLYGGLTPGEASEITQMLDGMGTKYDLREDGSVYVPSADVGRLRMAVAGEGLVGASTSGYEIFDKSSAFGTTSFVQDINAKRALEGELARTIMALPAIQQARVHIVLPKQNLFSRETVQPTAAVAVNTGGRTLDQSQVNSIAQLIAAAVPNLSPAEITVIDQRGNMLYDGKSQTPSANMLTGKLQQQIESSYEQRLTEMLERVVGYNKVSVNVAAEVNNERVEEQAEIFNPEQQVARSEQRVEDTLTSSSGGLMPPVGLDGNIPGDSSGFGGNNSSENQARTEETINYEIGRTIRNMVKEGGEVERLSVAVILEGRYEASTTDEDGNVTPGEYIPYSEAELAQFENIVKTAIGYNQARGDSISVTDMPFAGVEEMEIPELKPILFSTAQILEIAKQGLMVIGMLLVIMMVIRPAINAITRVPSAPPEALAAAGVQTAGPVVQGNTQTEGGDDSEGMIDIAKVDGKVRESTVKKVTEIIDQHPEESLTAVRSWMAGSSSGSDEDES